jgi:hypothetical protein
LNSIYDKTHGVDGNYSGFDNDFMMVLEEWPANDFPEVFLYKAVIILVLTQITLGIKGKGSCVFF